MMENQENRNRTAALHNLGCKVNAYETEAMQEMLEKAGYTIVPFTEKADVYVINTCSVTHVADQKSRQMLHRAKTLNPQAIVVAVGCYVETNSEAVKKDLSVDLILGNNCKHKLVEELETVFAGGNEGGSPEGITTGESSMQPASVFTEINEKDCSYEELSMTHPKEHTRAFLKVQDGCNQFCSYCIIPYARGRVRSRRIEDVISEVKGLAAGGVQEVVLTGIHLTSYGQGTNYSLIDLIEAIQKMEGIRRIRLGSLEPTVITEDFANRIAACDKLCPHFHLSLQSGCDETLKRMNRHYTTAQYAEGVMRLRKVYDHPAITTDVIVGFPGESEEEFAATVDFLEKIRFYEMHVFKYSVRKGTRAEKMPDQVAEEIKTARSKTLIAMGQKHSEEFRRAMAGRPTDLLLEERVTFGGRTYLAGYTPEYIRGLLPENQSQPNRILKGILTEELGNGMFNFLPQG